MWTPMRRCEWSRKMQRQKCVGKTHWNIWAFPPWRKIKVTSMGPSVILSQWLHPYKSRIKCQCRKVLPKNMANQTGLSVRPGTDVWATPAGGCPQIVDSFYWAWQSVARQNSIWPAGQIFEWPCARTSALFCLHRRQIRRADGAHFASSEQGTIWKARDSGPMANRVSMVSAEFFRILVLAKWVY